MWKLIELEEKNHRQSTCPSPTCLPFTANSHASAVVLLHDSSHAVLEWLIEFVEPSNRVVDDLRRPHVYLVLTVSNRHLAGLVLEPKHLPN